MDYNTYAEEVRNNLRSAGFEAVDGIEDGRFEEILAKRETGLRVGILNTMATVIHAEGMRSGDLREYTDAFREVLGEESFAKFNVGENMFGYAIFAVSQPDAELIDWSHEYGVRKRNSHVFPLVYDLGSKEIHTHDVPRIKNRGLYKKQKRDAKEYFNLGADDDDGGLLG